MSTTKGEGLLSGKEIGLAPRSFNYDKFHDQWVKVIKSQRTRATDILAINRPRTTLDPVAKGVLDNLCASLLEADAKVAEEAYKEAKEAAEDAEKLKATRQAGDETTKFASESKSTTMKAPKSEKSRSMTLVELEKKVRAYILRKGIASKVNQVTQRLNRLHMTDGRRWVLSAAYIYLLAKVFRFGSGKSYGEAGSDVEAGGIHELINDDLGVTEKIMLDLEADGGPMDLFSKMVVEAIMDFNNVKKSNILRNLVAQQVRSTI
jgi:hypothetical protein